MDMDIQINITETPENVSINIFENTNLVAVEAQEQVNDINISINDAPDVNITAEENVDNVVINIGDSTPGGAGHIIQDEGTALPTQPILNFLGDGVTVTNNDATGATDVTIPGSTPGGGSYTEITVADLQAAINGGTLTPGGAYLITDAAGFDGGFFTIAPTANSINPSGVGIFLNADFQAGGDYSGVEGVTGIAAGTQRGIWRLSFEAVTLPYTLLTPDYINYSGASGPLTDGEYYTTDGGHTGTIIHDDEAGTITLIPDQPLSPGEILTGDSSGNFVTVDSYNDLGFSAGDTITGQTSGATATVVSNDGSNLVINVTSSGTAFDPSEMFDNGNGTVGGTTGAASSPDIAQGDVVIWNLQHWQLVDATQVNGDNPADNTAAYTVLEKTVANVGYVTAYDVAEWDQINDAIEYRQDSRGNQIRPFSEEMQMFPWGNDDAENNYVLNGSIRHRNFIGLTKNNVVYGGAIGFETPNGNGRVQFNTVYSGADMSGTLGYTTAANNNTLFANASFAGVFGDSTIASDNILENSASLIGITAGQNCSISRNKVGQGATLGGGTVMGDGAQCNDSYMESGATLGSMSIGAGSSVNFSRIYSNGEISGHQIGDGSALNNTSVGVSASYSNKTISAGVFVTGFVVNIGTNSAETISSDLDAKKTEIGFSNFAATIDITGVTTLDYLLANRHVGILYLTSSNPTETLDTIVNFPTLFPFQLRPASGLTLTITGTPISTPIGAGKIALKQSSYVLDGSKNEYIELESDPTNSFLVEKRPVTGLL